MRQYEYTTMLDRNQMRQRLCYPTTASGQRHRGQRQVSRLRGRPSRPRQSRQPGRQPARRMRQVPTMPQGRNITRCPTTPM
jgi:hypothetical protein